MNNYQLFMDDNNFISCKVNFTSEHRKVYALIAIAVFITVRVMRIRKEASRKVSRLYGGLKEFSIKD